VHPAVVTGYAGKTITQAKEREMAKGRDKGGREPKKPKASKKTLASDPSPFKQAAPLPPKGSPKKA
jgi:hypothetical protein